MNDERITPLAHAVAPDAVSLERTLAGPIERVWSYLTDPQLRGRWLAAGPMEPRKGGSVSMRFQHSELSHEKQAPERYRDAEGYRFSGTVLRWEPPHALAYTWTEAEGAPSQVSFQLSEPERGQVRLVLTHRGLRDRDAQVSVAAGWHAHTAVLAAVLAGAPAPGFWSLHGAVEALYQQRMGPVVRVERRFEASAERVFDAFLDPAIARRFLFATPAGTMLRADIDARAGGRFCLVERRAQGDAAHHGVYRIIERPRHLVFSFSTDAAIEGDEVGIEITPDDSTGGCRLQLTHRMRPQWTDHAERTQAGWAMILETLERALS